VATHANEGSASEVNQPARSPSDSLPQALTFNAVTAVEMLRDAAFKHCIAQLGDGSQEFCTNSLDDHTAWFGGDSSAHDVPLANKRVEVVAIRIGRSCDHALSVEDTARLVRASVKQWDSWADRELGHRRIEFDAGGSDPLTLKVAGVTFLFFAKRGGDRSTDKWGNEHVDPLAFAPCSVARIDRESATSQKPNWQNLDAVDVHLLASLLEVRQLDPGRWYALGFPVVSQSP
jgi:hypothetical protein